VTVKDRSHLNAHGEVEPAGTGGPKGPVADLEGDEGGRGLGAVALAVPKRASTWTRASSPGSMVKGETGTKVRVGPSSGVVSRAKATGSKSAVA
jgi:hypothetical protein